MNSFTYLTFSECYSRNAFIQLELKSIRNVWMFSGREPKTLETHFAWEKRVEPWTRTKWLNTLFAPLHTIYNTYISTNVTTKEMCEDVSSYDWVKVFEAWITNKLVYEVKLSHFYEEVKKNAFLGFATFQYVFCDILINETKKNI